MEGRLFATDADSLRDCFSYNEIYYNVPPQNIEALATGMKNMQKVNDTLSRVKDTRTKLLAAELTTKAARQDCLEDLHLHKHLHKLLIRRREEALR